MKRIYFITILAVAVIPMVIFAEDSRLMEINKIPGLEQIRTTKPIHIGEYDGSGVIDDINNSGIVINDASFRLLSGIRIEKLNGDYYSKQLVKGMYIYYFLDHKRQISKIVVEQ